MVRRIASRSIAGLGELTFVLGRHGGRLVRLLERLTVCGPGIWLRLQRVVGGESRQIVKPQYLSRCLHLGQANSR